MFVRPATEPAATTTEVTPNSTLSAPRSSEMKFMMLLIIVLCLSRNDEV
jgi:hypothetical protein